jgi:hypothetical protein
LADFFHNNRSAYAMSVIEVGADIIRAQREVSFPWKIAGLISAPNSSSQSNCGPSQLAADVRLCDGGEEVEFSVRQFDVHDPVPSKSAGRRFAQSAISVPSRAGDKAGVDGRLMPVTPLLAGDNSHVLNDS